MADLLPDIPADAYNSWAADQFMQAAQEKIAGIPGDIASGVQNMVAPPAPPPPQQSLEPPAPPPPPPDVSQPTDQPTAPLIAPPPAPTPATDFSTPPPPPPPVDTAPPPAPTDTTPAPTDMGQPSSPPPPDQGQPASYDDLVNAGWQTVQGGAQQAGQAAAQAPASFDDLVNAGWQQVQGGAQAAGQAAGQVPANASDLLNAGWQVVSGDQQQQQPQQSADQQSPAGGMVFPVQGFKGPVQDHWGSVLGGSDLMAPRGTPISVMEGGKVLESGWDNVGGNSLLIQGNDGNQYYYAHFDKPSDLKVGQQVTAGTYVAPVGNTGDASGGPTHLHIGIGPDIKLGADKYGGTGGDYNAVGLLQSTLDAQNNPQQGPLQAAGSAVAGAGQSVQDLLNQGWQVVSGAGQSAAQAAQSLGVQGPTPQTPGDLIDQARQAAIAAGVDPDIFARQIQQESGFQPFNPDGSPKQSPAGAIGIAQFMPGTAAGMHIDPTNPQQSLTAAAQLDAQNLAKYGGDYAKALAAYNAGGGNVDKYNGVPPFAETQSYVNTILGGAKDVVQNAGSSAQGAAQQVAANAQDLLNAGWQVIGGGADQAGQAAQNALSDAAQGAQDLVSAAQQQGQDLSSYIQQAPDAAAQIIQQAADTSGQSVQDLLSGAGGAMDAASNLGQDLTPTGIGQTTLQDAQDLAPRLAAGGSAALDVLNQEQQQREQQQANLLPDFLAQVEAARTGDWSTFLQKTAGLAGYTMGTIPIGAPADVSPALSAALTAAGVDPNVARVLGQAGNLVAPIGIERGVPAAADLAGTGASSVLDLLSDPAVQAALSYRQAGESDINFALGGLPSLFSKPEEALPENASNAARAVYTAAQQANILPASGAGLLQRALDDLSAYPDEVADPIRQFATATDAPSSNVAATIQQWMLQNPLESVPNPITGPSALARNAGQQAVSDIANAVMSGPRAGVGAGALPTGTLPSLLAGQTSPLLEGDVGAQARALLGRTGAGYLPPGVMPGQEALLSGKDLFTRGAQTLDPELVDWAQRALGRGSAQPGLPQGGGLLDELLSALEPAQRGAPYQPQQTLGTYQQAFARGEGGLADIIDSLIATPRPTEAVPPSLLAQIAAAPGDTASKIGSFIASGLSPAENLPPDVQAAFQKFAATVGSNSEAANVWARLRAESGGLEPDVEQRMAAGLRTQATNDFMQAMRDQKLAAPLGADPAAPGFTAPKGQGWKLASQDPASPLSRWMVHPDLQGPINAVVGRSQIAAHPIGSAYLKLSGTGKANIFNLSNFHTYTTALNSFFSDPQVAANMARAFVSDSFARGLRGKMGDTIGKAADAGVTSMLGRAAPDVEGDLSAVHTALSRAIGGTVAGGGSAAAGYAEAKIAGKSDEEARGQALRFGLAGAMLGGVPMEVGGRGTVAEELGKALWERAMPIAKASVWKGLTDGGMDATTAAKVTNERFGGLNYAMMGRNPTLQDALRMTLISPDYLESTIRQAGRAVGGAGAGEARGFLGKSLGGMMLTTELINHATTGHWTDKNQPGHQFEVEMQDPNGSFSHTGLIAGNYLTFLNLANKIKADTSAKGRADLINFATARANPLVGTLAEAAAAARSSNSLTQPYGYGKAGVSSILSNLAPIGISQVAQGMNSGGISPEAAVIMAALGLNPRYTNPTTAAGTTASSAARAATSGRGPAVRPAPTVRPAATPRAIPTPRPAPAKR